MFFVFFVFCFFYISTSQCGDSSHCKGSVWLVALIWESTALEHWFSVRSDHLSQGNVWGIWGALFVSTIIGELLALGGQQLGLLSVL